MRRFYFLALMFSACVSSTHEGASDMDSVASQPYEDFSEVAPFTVKEDIIGQVVNLNGEQRPLLDYLVRFYHPDPYLERLSRDSLRAAAYIITEAKVIEDRFFSGKDMPCQKRSVLITSRGDFVDKEYYDLLVLAEDSTGELMLTDKIIFDGSEGESSTVLSAQPVRMAADSDCRILMITSTSESVALNLKKTGWVEYYTADSKSFRRILRIETEKTEIQDHEITGEESQSSFSENRELRILSRSTNGLFDVEVIYIKRQNGNLILQSREVFAFNGTEYVSKLDGVK